MAIYRNIYLGFWNDNKVEDMTKDERYFFLYLLTNPHTNLLGCYEISLKQMRHETDLSDREIIDLFIRLDGLNLAQYDYQTREVFILNWHKYNWTLSDKLLKSIQKEIENVKSFAFKKSLIQIGYRYGMDTVSLEEKYPIQEENTSMDTRAHSVSVSVSVPVTVSDTVSEEEREDKEEGVGETKEEKGTKNKTKKLFTSPTYEEVETYANSRGRGDLAKTFFDYFEAGGWIDSKGQRVINWKQKFITWEQGRSEKKPAKKEDDFVERYEAIARRLADG